MKNFKINLSITLVTIAFSSLSYGIEACQSCNKLEGIPELSGEVFKHQLDQYNSAELKACLFDLNWKNENIWNNIPNLDDKAIPLKCGPGPKDKLSTQFTSEEMSKNEFLRAYPPQVFVYLTSSGIRYAEYPSYYQFVKYSDGAIDVGIMPRNIMPITLDDGAEAFIADASMLEQGKVLTMNHLEAYASVYLVNGTAAKAQAGYINKYNKILSDNQLPQVSLKSTTSIESEKIISCIQKELDGRLLSVVRNLYSLTYLYKTHEDIMTASKSFTDKEKIKTLKEKYRPTPLEFSAKYTAAVLKQISSCQKTITREEVEKAVNARLGSFLVEYDRTKRYIDNI